MELNKCPNCSGRLELAPNRKRMICAYCGSEFALDDAMKQDVEDNPIARDWFVYDWDYKTLTGNDKYNVCVQPFVRALNEYDSSDRIEKYMRDYLMTFDEVAGPGIREEKMKYILAKISGSMEPGERVIIYNDDGIFVHGKTGVVVTDKRTFFVEKKRFREIRHVNVPYILFGYSVGLPEIKLGEQYANSISTFNSHYELMGTVAALVCTLSFEQRPDRPKIKLTSSVK
ncbi:MAG: hypothetical protein IKH76_03385 [Clostridiales bacterium]|nr:hypothetical protein [Clostridiales bacterium]